MALLGLIVVAPVFVSRFQNTCQFLRSLPPPKRRRAHLLDPQHRSRQSKRDSSPSRGLWFTQAFIKDGRVQVADSPSAAEAVLAIQLDSYNREPTIARSDDTTLTRRFDVLLKASATLTQKGKTLFENRKLVAKRSIFTDSGQLQAEYKTMSLLANELARAAVHATLNTW